MKRERWKIYTREVSNKEKFVTEDAGETIRKGEGSIKLDYGLRSRMETRKGIVKRSSGDRGRRRKDP